jgi:hypothetical protein
MQLQGTHTRDAFLVRLASCEGSGHSPPAVEARDLTIVNSAVRRARIIRRYGASRVSRQLDTKLQGAQESTVKPESFRAT